MWFKRKRKRAKRPDPKAAEATQRFVNFNPAPQSQEYTPLSPYKVRDLSTAPDKRPTQTFVTAGVVPVTIEEQAQAREDALEQMAEPARKVTVHPALQTCGMPEPTNYAGISVQGNGYDGT
jgi:hypothetical protein